MEIIQNLLTVQNIILYTFIINVIGFLAMFVDKSKAKRGSWRIPEKTLITIALIGGSIGGIIGMYVFRHKTQKPRFAIGFPVIFVLQIVLIVYFCLIK